VNADEIKYGDNIRQPEIKYSTDQHARSQPLCGPLLDLEEQLAHK